MSTDRATPLEQMVPPAGLRSIKFDFMTAEVIEKNASVNIVETSDLTSSKLGLPNPSSICETCGSSTVEYCDGHSGLIKLPAVIYHPYFLSEVVQILNQICPWCQSVKHDLQMKRSSYSDAPKGSQDELQLEKIFNALNDDQRKLLRKLIPASAVFMERHKAQISGSSTISVQVDVPNGTQISVTLHKRQNFLKSGVPAAEWESGNNQLGCKYCSKQRNSDEWYPRMKFKIVKDKPGSKNVSVIAEVNDKLPKKFKNKNPSDVLAKDYWDFVPRNMQESEFYGTTKMVLSPSQAFYLFKELDNEFIEKYISRRELLFLSCLPVTSNCHRVSEVTLPHASGPQLIFDGRTMAYKSLLNSKRKVDDLHLHHHLYGGGISKIIANHALNCLSLSNLQASSSINMKLSSSKSSGLKWIKGVVLGKRSDHTFNMIVVGDPKIKLFEIGIPCGVSQRLVVAESVTSFNNEKLTRSCNFHLFQKKETSRIKRIGSDLRDAPKIGDILYRPLEDGDLVLTYRPPSVHQHSLIAFKVKILPVNSVVSINPLCCDPFKGDFDGDILFGYIPQSVQCRAELDQLVSLDNQLLNGQDGRNLVSLSHDSLTAAYLLTGTDIFLNKFQMQQLQMLCPCKLAFPAIIKSPSHDMPIWTGRQLFSSLLPSTLDFALASEELLISNGEILLSPTESFWLQNKTTGLFSTLFKCYGSKALEFLFAAQDVLCEWISSTGFSVSLNDLYICSDQQSRRKMIDEVGCGLQYAKHVSYMRSVMMDPEMVNHFTNAHQNLSYMTSYEMDQGRSLKMKSGLMKKHSVVAFKEVFQDIQTLFHHFAKKENSLLQMIHAGSKGSFTKLFQQGVCLGLQHPNNLLSFKIPSKLSCYRWNQQKCLDLHGVLPDTVECEEEHGACIVVESSFLEGLNPFECFLHALSARGNFFSENAELPGTLNQKLMFHMRDLYMAYDGTVRNPYGQQVVQFSYADEISTELSDNTYDAYGSGGQPVGALASCSISEAAYGGLEQPASFMSSPLMNLKKVFDSCQNSTSTGQTISLALSRKLKRWYYGYEYAALEVQGHLERVLLSDIVTAVLIVYAGKEVKGSVSPWISHFHLNKQRMLQRRITIQYIIDVLERKFNMSEDTTIEVSSKLHILSRKCAVSDQEAENNDLVCFTVTSECSEFLTKFEDVRDTLVPFLLQTVIRGFNDYNRVDILWDDRPNSPRLQNCSSGELFLKVHVSKNRKPKMAWSDIQCACIPIMDLIDWERSYPDSVSDIRNSHGIESARNFFLETLRNATSDLGRTVREQHLCLVADCLTVTGEFCGLTAKGIRLQRNYFGISSPFMQGCSFRTADTFINAAKQGDTDYLLGTIDAMAWGKEAPVGTGGSFDILYSGKVHALDKPASIYEALAGHLVSQKDYKIAKKPCKYLSVKRDRAFADEFIRKQNTCGVADGERDAWVQVMSNRLQNILHNNQIHLPLNEQDMSYVMHALSFHPESNAKIGIGVKEIKIGYHPSHPKSRCFFVIRKDGTTEDFSFNKCVAGASNPSSLGCTAMPGRRNFEKHLFKE